MEPLGLYLHIPFCAAICNYCNFNRGLLDDALKARYVDALETRDPPRAAEPATAADTIYFGGGTPSLLTPAEVARVISTRAARAFALAADTEVTLEANPGDGDAASRSPAFARAGVNRLSFGVQSFRDEELRRLGRLHSAGTRARRRGRRRAAPGSTTSAST